MTTKTEPKRTTETRHRIRVTLDDEVFEAMHRATRGNVTGDVINEACRRVYVAGGLEAALEAIHRDLGSLGVRQRRTELRHQVMLELFVVFTRTFFTVFPDLPEGERAAAGANADARIGKMMDVVAQTVGRESSIIGRSHILQELLLSAGEIVNTTEPLDKTPPETSHANH